MNYNRKYYLEHKQELLRKIREHRQLPEVKVQRREYNRQYVEQHHEQVVARKRQWNRRKAKHRKLQVKRSTHSLWKQKVWRPWMKAWTQLKIAERFKEIREVMDAFKDVPCTDCGGRFPPCAMDFDHVRGEKRMHVGWMFSRNNLQAILDEIEKCEVVCANCHRIRTHERKLK